MSENNSQMSIKFKNNYLKKVHANWVIHEKYIYAHMSINNLKYVFQLL